MYKIGLSTCGSKPLNEETFKSFAESGLQAMEISLPPLEYEQINYSDLKRFSDEYNIKLSYHLPFYMPEAYEQIDPSDLEKEIRKKTIDLFAKLINRASEIGIDKFIVHASKEPITYDVRRQRMEYAKQSLCQLADIAQKCGGVIAVEDLPRTCLGNTSEEILELLEADSRLMVCLDTNHLLHESNADFIRKIGNRIITTHISDYDFINERHWLPGEGKVNWNDVLDALGEINYSGVWMYEISYKPAKTIIRPRDLVPSDFYTNAKEIFSRKSPTLISTGKNI